MCLVAGAFLGISLTTAYTNRMPMNYAFIQLISCFFENIEFTDAVKLSDMHSACVMTQSHMAYISFDVVVHS